MIDDNKRANVPSLSNLMMTPEVPISEVRPCPNASGVLGRARSILRLHCKDHFLSSRCLHSNSQQRGVVAQRRRSDTRNQVTATESRGNHSRYYAEQ